ncbi:MAG: Crp/Fnr family transcriptional regulator [Anaerolineae bacterium]
MSNHSSGDAATGPHNREQIRAALLHAQPYLAVLNEEGLAFLTAHTIERSYTKGEIILLEGDPGEGLAFVVEGRARIYKLSPEGREQVLRYCGPGESFNEVSVFDNGPNPANVVAATNCLLWIVPRAAFMELVQTRPELALAIIQNLGARLRHLVRLVEDLSLRQVSARLAKLLLETADDREAARTLTQHEMAARVGTVREMVGRSLKQLETRGLIAIQSGRIVIIDRAGLEKVIS